MTALPPPLQRLRGGWLPLAVGLLALGVRLLYLWQIRDNPFFDSPVIDAQTYYERALSLAAGRWGEDEVYWQPPLYPWLLGALFSLFGGPSLWGVRLVQAALGASSAAMTAVAARRWFGEGAGWIAGVGLALHGPMLFFDGELLSPVLIVWLGSLAWVLLSPPGEGECSTQRVLSMTPRRWAAVGGVLGVSAVARPDVALFVGALVLWLALSHPGGRRRAGLLLLCFWLPTAPVTALNRIQGGEWVWISSNGGVNFYLGNSADYDATVGIRPGVDWKALMREPGAAGIAQRDAGGQSAWWTRRALGEMRADPIGWLGTLAYKGALLLGAEEIYRNLDLRFFARYAPLLPGLPGWGFLLPWACLGLWVAARQGKATLPLLWLGTYAAAILAFFVAGRYRLPMVPVLWMLAGAGVLWAVGAWRARDPARWRALTAVVLVAALAQVGAPGAGRVNESEGWNLVGKALANKGDHAASIEPFMRAAELDPAYLDPPFNLARAYQLTGQIARAIPLYERVYARYPDDPELASNLGVCYLQGGRPAEGLALLERAVTMPGSPPDARFNLAQGLSQVGRLDEALAMLAQVEAQVLPAGVKDQLGQTWQRLRVMRGAALEAAANPAPPTPPDERIRERNAAAWRLLSAGEYGGAEGLLAPLVVSHPGVAVLWLNLGQAWLGLGLREEAVVALRRATTLDPDKPGAWLGLGIALSGAGEELDRRRALEQFLALAPEHPRAGEAKRLLEGAP